MSFHTEVSALMYGFFLSNGRYFIIIKFILIYHIIPTNLFATPGTAYSHPSTLALIVPSYWFASSRQ